jgi:hypothetical protein
MSLTPFADALSRVLSSVSSSSSLPSACDYSLLLDHLSHQESKIRALDSGLLYSLFSLYESESASSSFDCRCLLISVLDSLILLSEGRRQFYTERVNGIQNLCQIIETCPLTAPAVPLRISLARFVVSLTQFSDVNFSSSVGSAYATLSQLVENKFQSDPEQSVTLAFIPALVNLTSSHPQPVLHSSTITRLKAILIELCISNSKQIQDIKLQVLMIIWNSSRTFQQKNEWIQEKVIDLLGREYQLPGRGMENLDGRHEVEPLWTAYSMEFIRICSGIFASLSVMEKGKVPFLVHPTILQEMSQFIIDYQPLVINQSEEASIISSDHFHYWRSSLISIYNNIEQLFRNVVERESGCLLIGKELIHHPLVMIRTLGEKSTAIYIQRKFQQINWNYQENTSEQEEIVELYTAMSYLSNDKNGIQGIWNILNIIEMLASNIVEQENQGEKNSLAALSRVILLRLIQSNHQAKKTLVQWIDSVDNGRIIVKREGILLDENGKKSSIQRHFPQEIRQELS